MVSNISCDQVSKKIVRTHVSPHSIIAVAGKHVTLTNIENPGAMLSFGASLSPFLKTLLLSVLPLLIITLVFVYTIRKKHLAAPLLWGLCFIMGGGIGNLLDRILYGSVTDFMHIKFGIFETAVFNMADVSIMVGTLLILFYTFLRKSKTPLPVQR
jgi:signal peptidase II